MQQAIDQILGTVSSPATAEVARQELQERWAAQQQDHARSVTTLEAEHSRRTTALVRERDEVRSERDVARQDRFELRQRVAELTDAQARMQQQAAELEQQLAPLRQRATELEEEQAALAQRATDVEREHVHRLTELEASHGRRVAELDDAHARRVMELEDEHARRVTRLGSMLGALERKFRITSQRDILRHVFCATADFTDFTTAALVAVGCNGVVLQCSVSLPAWCALDPSLLQAAVPDAAAADDRGGRSRRMAHRVQLPVAVKILAGVDDPRHSLLQHRFMSEYKSLSSMPPHDNIIALLAVLTKRLPQTMYDLLPSGFKMLVGRASNPVLALVMPLYPCTLEAAAADAEPAQVLRWCLEVSAAVAHMWEHGWVHLDLKLNNVLVADDGRAVLTDMGTAMPVAANGFLTVPTHMGLAGNPAHRAPEVLGQWTRALRERTMQVTMDAGRQEVWALGVLLHELAAGKHPYGEDYPTAGYDRNPMVDEARLLERRLPAAIVAVLRRMVARDPAARPANPELACAELMAGIPMPAAALEPHTAAADAALLFTAAEMAMRAVQQAFRASQLNMTHDPTSGRPVPNAWCRLLRAWSEEHAAARMCFALLQGNGWGGEMRDEERAKAQCTLSMPWCRVAAEGGEHVAKWLLGVCLDAGWGTAQDHAKAVEWYRRAAAQGDAEAQFSLGWCLAHGRGVALSLEEAARCYQQAADQGHAEAQFSVGWSFELGQGVHCDTERAVSWYRRAAEQGHAVAQNKLGCCFAGGRGVGVDEAQAAVWYRRAAEQGLALAQSNLGVCYAYGSGVAEDHEQAVAWFGRAATQGNAVAQTALGMCYASGQGVGADERQAMEWWQRAAAQGHAPAQFNIGVCFENGHGVGIDYAQAVAWYQQAAAGQDADAQCNLGMCFQRGRGVDADQAQAVLWYRQAASQGHGLGLNNLGLCYETGRGVEQNLERAVELYLQAAERGCALAQFNLGVCNEYGRGVEVSLTQAVNWYQQAAQQGYAGAQNALQRLRLQ